MVQLAAFAEPLSQRCAWQRQHCTVEYFGPCTTKGKFPMRYKHQFALNHFQGTKAHRRGSSGRTTETVTFPGCEDEKWAPRDAWIQTL